MPSLKDNKSCALLEQYLSYLVVVKGRSPLTAEEYRIDNNMLFEFVKRKRGVPAETLALRDFSDVDIDFIKSITVGDMYDFISYCGATRKVTTSTRARKIVSIRQFWKYLKNKANRTLDLALCELLGFMTDIQKSQNTLFIRSMDLHKHLLQLLHDLQELEQGK